MDEKSVENKIEKGTYCFYTKPVLRPFYGCHLFSYTGSDTHDWL